REVAKQELESLEIRELRRRHGYGLPEIGPAPAVFSLNGVIANLALTEFTAMITGIRQPARHLTYKGMRGVVTNSRDEQKSDCFTCGYLRGKKEKDNIWRYLLPSDS